MRQLGGWLSDAIDGMQLQNTAADPDVYHGDPLAPAFSFAEFQPGGKYFPYAVLGAAVLAALLIFQLTRR